VILGCVSISTPKLTDEPVGSEVSPTAELIIPSDTTTPNLSDGALSCEGMKWQIVPSHVYQFPLGDGFKLVIAELAITNASQYWGHVSSVQLSVSTEGGFSYKPETDYSTIPEIPASPYANLRPSDTLINTGLFGFDIWMPPNFTMLGERDSGNQYKFQRQAYGAAFHVAESQQSLTLHLDGLKIECMLPELNEPYEEEVPSRSIELVDAQLPTLPTDQQRVELENLTVPNVGSITYSGYRLFEEGDMTMMALDFNFINANAGYATSGTLVGYIIGNDGFAIKATKRSSNPGLAYFEAGPGQTTSFETEPLVQPSSEVSNLWVILRDPTNILRTVYALPYP
jgi:hypothetical protein